MQIVDSPACPLCNNIPETIEHAITNCQKTHTLADFKYGVTFNTHGNINRSVYPSPSTQSKMLTSRPNTDVSNGVT